MSRIEDRIALIGRENELNRLNHAWAEAVKAHACAVLVSGDAGVGKTRLIAELADSVAESGRVLYGHCVGLDRACPPYLAFFEMLDQALEERPDLAEQFQVLSSLRKDAGGNQPHDQIQVFDGALNLLTELSEEKPTLWVIEDLHWADAAMRDLLHFLLARIDTQRLLIVLTYRSDDVHRTHALRPLLTQLARMRRVERIDLPPFNNDEAHAFVQSLATARTPAVFEGSRPDNELIARVVDRAEGNAFFAEELFDSGDAELGEPLTQVLMSRFEALSATAAQVAKQVAVSSQRALSHEVLEMVMSELDDYDLDIALRECVDHHILVPTTSGSYGFRHSLLSEAIYNDLLPGERTRLHGIHAQALAELNIPVTAALRAYHFRASNDLAGALSAYLDAAQEAAAVAAPADELTLLENALGLWGAVPDADNNAGTDHYEVLVRASVAAAAAGRADRQLSFTATAHELAETSSSVRRRADAKWRYAQALSATRAGVEQATQLLTEALALLNEDGPSTERAWVLNQLVFEALHDDHRTYALRALDDARHVGDSAAEVDALVNLAFIAQHEGDHHGGIAQLGQALDLARNSGAHHGAIRVWFNLSITEYDAGRLSRASEHAAAGLAYAKRLGLRWATYGRELLSLRVVIDYTRGAWTELASDVAPTGEHHTDTSSALLSSAAALLYAARGDWEQVDAAVARTEGLEVTGGRASMLVGFAQAERDLWLGDPVRAAEHMAELLTMLKQADAEFSELATVRVHAIALAAQADIAERARQQKEPLIIDQAVRIGLDHLAEVEGAMVNGRPRGATVGPEARAWAARARAEASRLRGAGDPEPWRDAVEAFGYGDVYEQALARWRLASVLPAGAEREDVLKQALQVGRQLGANPLVEAVSILGHSLGVTLPQAVGQQHVFTPREQAVMALVAKGLTNRAIGQELFISAKTVSVHLSRAMAKLGVSSRTEAVSRAMQRGLLPH